MIEEIFNPWSNVHGRPDNAILRTGNRTAQKMNGYNIRENLLLMKLSKVYSLFSNNTPLIIKKRGTPNSPKSMHHAALIH